MTDGDRDPDVRDYYKDRDLDFREREFQQRKVQHEEQQKAAKRAAGLSRWAVGVSAFAVVATLGVTQCSYHQSTTEFEASSRVDYYNRIVDGLGGSSAAVQTNSMRLLTDFVTDEDKYADDEAQLTAMTDAVQILTAFIEDNNTVPDRPGLSLYQSPVPIVLSRAMARLRLLLEDPRLGLMKTDISRANLHGITLRGFAPTGGFLAVAADFRRADLTNLDLGDKEPPLNSSFFTCATLENADLGKADLAGADLSGANLSGADLSDVQHLEADQLVGVTITPETAMPPGLALEPTPEWGTDSPRCVDVVNDMTGMRGGQGYTRVLPCAETMGNAKELEFDPPFKGDLADLVEVCRRRIPPPSNPRY